MLTAVSGASALFAYENYGTFMPKYANLYIGMDKRIADATGFGWEWVSFEDAAGAWELLKETIDSGRPVKGWNEENVIFAGYQEADKDKHRKIFAMSDGADYFAEWWTWKDFTKWISRWSLGKLGRHTKEVQKMPEEKVAFRVLTDLVNWSEHPPNTALLEFPDAKFGLAGIQAYAADCANTEKYKDWSACHDINPQWTVRNSTAEYLKRLAASDLFPVQVNDGLLAAAKQYQAAYAAWREFYNELGHGAPKGAGRKKENRLAGAAAVQKALEHEKAGLLEIKRILSVAI